MELSITGKDLKKISYSNNKYSLEELLDSKVLQSSLLEKFPGMVYICKNDMDWTILYVNRACEDITGFQPREISHNKIVSYKDVIYPEDREYVKKEVDKGLEKDGEFQIEYRIISKNGKVKWVSETGYSVGNTNYGLLKGFILDITKSRNTEERLARSYTKIQKAFDDTINALASIVEVKDPYTSGHQKKVAKIATDISNILKLTKRQISSINVASLIHDIGKIGLPASILTKPGKLTDVEYELIKSHAKMGYDMVKDVSFPWPIKKIILQHHERLNGSGYPDGLKDEDIALEAKILAVADVVEAMISHRPYRAALGHDEAIKELKKNKGILYDERVVDAYLKISSK